MQRQGGVRIPKASDYVVNAIRSEILGGNLAVGTRLQSETELADRFGLGRVTVREALRLLERDGLVTIRRGPSGGIFVSHPNISQVSEALALLLRMRNTSLGAFAAFRLQVEPLVTELAAINATDEQRERILAVARADLGVERTADLHDMVAEASGNDVFEFTLKAMHVALDSHFREERITAENRDGTRRAHERIAERIAARDPAGARAAMERHLLTYQEYLETSGLIDEPVIPPAG